MHIVTLLLILVKVKNYPHFCFLTTFQFRSMNSNVCFTSLILSWYMALSIFWYGKPNETKLSLWHTVSVNGYRLEPNVQKYYFENIITYILYLLLISDSLRILLLIANLRRGVPRPTVPPSHTVAPSPTVAHPAMLHHPHHHRLNHLGKGHFNFCIL